jgi:hypothetical protein
MSRQLVLFLKLFLLVSFLSYSHGILNAQVFRGGMKAGLVASQVSGDNLAGPDKTGFYGGAFANYPLSGHESLQLEVMYIEKGSRSQPSEENQFYDYLFTLRYVEIPLMFIQEFAQFTSLQYIENLSAHGGLSASFLVNWDETNNGYSIINPDRENFYTAELNILLGLSYPVNESLFFNLGFSNSLTPVRPHASNISRWNNYGQYNSIWTAGLSYVFW